MQRDKYIMDKLVNLVKKDIIEFLETNHEFLFNERDFQMHLAVYLRQKGNYDDVDVEYYVPYKVLKDYIWENELRIDVLVRKSNEYLPIELKYKTAKVMKDILRFDEKIQDIEVLKNQGAEDIGMYDFWKDVRRIELVRNRFPVVHNGLAVFVTNDPQYLNQSRPTSNNFLLNMNEGEHGKLKHWQKSESTCAKKYPNFEVERNYAISWNMISMENLSFHYCVVEI